jgi:hypothetical protein
LATSPDRTEARIDVRRSGRAGKPARQVLLFEVLGEDAEAAVVVEPVGARAEQCEIAAEWVGLGELMSDVVWGHRAGGSQLCR